MDKEAQNDIYTVSRRLNEPKRYIGCTIDELVPAVIALMLGMASSSLLLSASFAAFWIISLKRLKKRYGMSFLSVVIFWKTDKYLSQSIFKKTPPSEYKNYLN